MKNAIKTQFENRKTTARKVGAAFATYQTVNKAAKKAADRYCHVWKVESDYTYDTYEAAQRLAVEVRNSLPYTRNADTYRTHEVRDRAEAKEWTWLPIKGTALGIQFRTPVYDEIEFRAIRQSDLSALKKRIFEIEEEMTDDDDDIDLNVEVRRRTTINSWDKGEWTYRKDRFARTFTSVVIPVALQQEIEDDLRRFTESKERLLRLEMPWRRGYMLDGPPGTGKTSMALAIAGCLNFSLASLSLSEIKDDADLRKAVGSLPGRTVLVIEDIDAFGVSRDRDHNAQQDGGLSLSGLLNSLDGFETPDGLVTILTTNHLDHLDPALVRSGRVDRSFHLGYIDGPELERLFGWFYEKKTPTPAPSQTLSAELAPAEVAELFKQHLEDGQGGWEAVIERIREKTTPRLEVAA